MSVPKMTSVAFPNQATLIPQHNQKKLTADALCHSIQEINPLIDLPCLFPKICLYNHNLHFHLCLSQHSYNTRSFPENPYSFMTKKFILLAFSFALLCLRTVFTILLPEFPQRWTQHITFSKQAESELMSSCPHHLIQAVVAYEDRRFFRNCGVARAVLSLSSRDGGSAITQQLVKNSFLKNERTFLRKIVEMILALALEGTISKMEILSAYLCKIYWGHGIYGIQSASEFYFGKHISLLTLRECAMLAAMIPAPELRSPFRDSSRGKIFEARVLKRMVVFGFLDVEMASIAVKQPLRFNSRIPDHSDGFLVISSSSQEFDQRQKLDDVAIYYLLNQRRREKNRDIKAKRVESSNEPMAYVERGVVKSKRSIWRLKTITDFFWSIINFISVFFVTMFSMEKTDAYRKGSGSSKKWDGGGPGGPGSGPYGGGPRGPPRGLDNVRGIDHNSLPACGSCCG